MNTRTATFSGHWVSNKHTDVPAIQHVDKADLLIYAVHDDGWTKMVGLTKSGERVDGRYVHGNVQLDATSVSKAWDSPSGKNVGKLYYTIGYDTPDKSKHLTCIHIPLTSGTCIANDTEFYFYIRGHIRNSFETDRLKNFVKLLKLCFPSIKFILQTWKHQQCKNGESWRQIEENTTVISKPTLEKYFEDKNMAEQCLIIDEESIELVGSTNGKIGVGPCPKRGWKNMWYGIYKGIEHLDVNSSKANMIVSFRYDYFDIHKRANIEEEIIQFINKNLENKNIQFIMYGIQTDNLYMGRFNKMKALIERFHFKLDDILDMKKEIYHQEYLVNIIAQTYNDNDL